MASLTRKISARYMFAKFWHATEECLQEILNARSGTSLAKATSAPQPTSLEVITQALAKFRESYNQRLTTVMYLAGPAMAPAINKAGLHDREAVEKLVVRQIPRPTTRTVFVGDIVAFTSPLTPSKDDESHVMVRRIAALEGEELLSVGNASDKDAEEEVLEVPKGQLWVLADNEKLKPPQVIDSRTFGFIPISNVIGRVIFSGTSSTECGPVTNNPISVDLDQPIIDAEVDPEQLFADSKE